jgi:hypothetical protein
VGVIRNICGTIFAVRGQQPRRFSSTACGPTGHEDLCSQSLAAAHEAAAPMSSGCMHTAGIYWPAGCGVFRE